MTNDLTDNINKIIHGGSQQFLPFIKNESVDFAYLDPPFNKDRYWNLPSGVSHASVEETRAFKDRWYKNNFKLYWKDLGKIFELSYEKLRFGGIMALHIDDVLLLDLGSKMREIFEQDNGFLLSTISWKRYNSRYFAHKSMERIVDYILIFVKGVTKYTYNPQYAKKSEKQINSYNKIEIQSGRKYTLAPLERNRHPLKNRTRIIEGKTYTTNGQWNWSQDRINKEYEKNSLIFDISKTGRPRYKLYLDEHERNLVSNVWSDEEIFIDNYCDDFLSPTSNERKRMKYPTQKPFIFIERLVKMFSNKNNLVLDPFFGSGTTGEVCLKNERNFIGIEINTLACKKAYHRLYGNDIFNYSEKILNWETSYTELRNLDGHAIEEKLANILGFELDENRFTGDRGVDGWFSDNVAIQIKNWKKDISNYEIEAFSGALASRGLSQGVFICNDYTQAATLAQLNILENDSKKIVILTLQEVANGEQHVFNKLKKEGIDVPMFTGYATNVEKKKNKIRKRGRPLL